MGKSKHKLTVMTYNIHKGFGVANIKFKLPEIRQALQKIDPDVIFLQEIQGAHSRREERVTKWPVQPQCAFLAEGVWPYFAYGKNALYRGGHHGNAILSKSPILQWENLVLSKYRRASRSLLHAVLDLPFVPGGIHVICIHFALFKTSRKKQLEALKRRIFAAVPAGAPLIIAGDFNDWRGKAEQFVERELGMREVFKVCQGENAKTFPSWRPRLPVDRIYFRNLECTECVYLNKLPWRKLSDHVPLYAEVAVTI